MSGQGHAHILFKCSPNSNKYFSFYKGHYATGKALEEAGVVSSNDMTLEAISCKIAYLMGRRDLEMDEIAKLMCVSIRGEGEYCNV